MHGPPYTEEVMKHCSSHRQLHPPQFDWWLVIKAIRAVHVAAARCTEAPLARAWLKQRRHDQLEKLAQAEWAGIDENVVQLGGVRGAYPPIGRLVRWGAAHRALVGGARPYQSTWFVHLDDGGADRRAGASNNLFGEDDSPLLPPRPAQ